MITIITVTYNCVSSLEETLMNVLEHDVANLEYIVVDGGSVDGTVEMLERYALNDHRLRWLSEPDNGIYDAMNKGWQMVQEESMILYLGAGDLLLKLPAGGEFLKNQNVIIYGDVESNGLVFRSKSGVSLKHANTIHHQSLLVPKKLHPSPPFDLRFKCYADFDFNQRLYKKGVRFVYSENLRTYFAPDGLSSQKDRCELFMVIKKNFGLFGALVAMVTTPFRQSCWQIRAD